MLEHQTKLKNIIDSFPSLPHSILLLGEFGAGHSDVCSYISNKFNLSLCVVEESVNIDIINDILSVLSPTLFIFNLNSLSIREQNVMLKLIEEPTKYAYIILNANSNDFILDTIKNRVYALKFEHYHRDQLSALISTSKSDIEKQIVLDVCNTPGLIDIANHTNIDSLFKLCSKMIYNMSGANFQNTLSISDKLNYKDLYDKYDIHLFIKMLKYVILNIDIKDKVTIYKIIKDGFDRIDSLTNKQSAVERVLIDLWRYFN